MNAKRPTPPANAEQLRSAQPVVCYQVEQLPAVNVADYMAMRNGAEKISATTIAPRDAETFSVPAGHFFRICSVQGSQVGDLNLWNADDLK